MFLEFLGIFLSLIFFAKYLQLFIKQKKIAAILSFTLALFIPFELLLPRYMPMWFPYDVWALFFMIVLLLFLRTRHYTAYLIAFILGTLNRETTIFVTLIGCILYWQDRSKDDRFRNFLLIQIAIWTLIKVIFFFIFKNSSGSFIVIEYMENVKFFIHTDRYYLFNNSVVEMVFRVAFLLGNFGFLWVFLVRYFRKEDDIFLRSSLIMLIPFSIVIFLVANIFEYRVFTEIIPIILTPVLVIIVRMIRTEKEEPNTEALNNG